ncbi:hypothetical protein ACLSYX_09210 [[Pasteurella] aerogenes]
MKKAEIINVFKKDGFKLRMDDDIVFGMIKNRTTIMCSFLGSNVTISISFSGLANKEKAEKLIHKLFPAATYIEQDKILTASYFSLPKVH